jgi:hypothetical protein
VIFIDAVGIGGPVLDRLRELGLPAVAVLSGNPARDIRFADLRTEIWWNGAQAIKDKKLALPNDPELLSELIGPMIAFNNKGKLKLESKEQMKKRGVGSPDIADSLMFTWAEPVIGSYEFRPSTVRALGRQRLQVDYDPFAEAAGD